MAKNNLNISLGVDVDNLKKGFEDAIRVTQAAGKKTEQEARLMAEGIVRQLDKIGNQSTMRGAIRQMENLAGQMQRVGLEGTKAFNEVIKQTGRLKDEQQDLKALIQTGGPAGAFIAMGNAAKVAMGGVNALQGAMTLMGAEGEDLQRTMVKLQAGMAFAQGLKELEGLRDTFTQLNMVVKANPILAIATAVAALGVALYELDGFLNHTVDQFDALSGVQKKAYESTVKERTELEYYQDRLNDANTSQAERSRLLQEVSQKYPEYLGQLGDEKLTQEQINTAIKNYINVLDLKARAQAAQGSYIEALKAENELKWDLIKQTTQTAQAQLSGNAAAAGALIIRQKYTEQQLKNAQIDGAYYKQLYQDLNKAAEAASNLQQAQYGKPKGGTTSKEQYVSPFPNKPNNIDISARGIFNPVGFGDMQKAFNVAGYSAEQLQEKLKYVGAIAIDTNAQLNAFTSDALTNMAAAMGTAISTGENLGKAIGTAFLTSLGQFLQQLGKFMITTASLWKGFQEALVKNPYLAIGLGVAAVASGAALVSYASKGPKVEKFATGGIVGGNSFMGDRVPAMLNSGEMVLNKQQQSNLFAIANGQKNASSKTGYIAETRISGRDLQILLKHAVNDTYRGG